MLVNKGTGKDYNKEVVLMENKPKVQWSPEWESRYQYVQRKYDNARTLGIDVLKVFLQAVIALNIIPIIFNEKIILLFQGHTT